MLPVCLDLVAITKECLKRGLAAVKPWGHLGDIGAAVSQLAHKHGYSVVEEFGGHGVGVEFHEDPFVAHVGKKGTGMLLVPGMIFTIGGLSAQWEYTVLVTETGAEVLSW